MCKWLAKCVCAAVNAPGQLTQVFVFSREWETFYSRYMYMNTLQQTRTHIDLILLMISTPDCSRRVLVTKLVGTTIFAELVFISSERRLLLFIT